MASAPFSPNDPVPMNSYKYKHLLRLHHEATKSLTERQEQQRKYTELSEKYEECTRKNIELNTKLKNKTLELDARNHEVARLKTAATEDNETIKGLHSEISYKEDLIKNQGDSLDQYEEKVKNLEDALSEERQNGLGMEEHVKMQNVRLREFIDNFRDPPGAAKRVRRNEESSDNDELALLNENVSLVIELISEQVKASEAEKKSKLAGYISELCKNFGTNIGILRRIQVEEGLLPDKVGKKRKRKQKKVGVSISLASGNPVIINRKKAKKKTCLNRTSLSSAIGESLPESPSPPKLIPFSPSACWEDDNDPPQSPETQHEEEGGEGDTQQVIETSQNEEVVEGEIGDEKENMPENSCEDEPPVENLRDDDQLRRNSDDNFGYENFNVNIIHTNNEDEHGDSLAIMTWPPEHAQPSNYANDIFDEQPADSDAVGDDDDNNEPVTNENARVTEEETTVPIANQLDQPNGNCIIKEEVEDIEMVDSPEDFLGY